MLGSRQPLDESNEPILRSPRVVTNFIIALFVVHIATLFLTEPQYNEMISNFALVPEQVATARFATFGEAMHVAAQFVTYAFLHSGFSHLIVNAVGFLIFGTAVARRVGTARFLVLTLIATVSAALTHLYFHWGEAEAVVGASGAVSGLMGAAFRFIFVNPNAQLVWPPALLPLFSRPVLTMSAVWALMNVGLGAAGWTPDGFGQSIAWEAHLGGFFAALLIFPLFDRRRSWIS